MRSTIILGVFLTLCFSSQADAQKPNSESTKIVRFEVDGKEVKKTYKVFFRSDGKWIESDKISTGFIVPVELRDREYLTVLITLGKYKLEFPDIHISKFRTDWVVGVDKKPFSNDIGWLIKSKTAKRAHYILFTGGEP